MLRLRGQPGAGAFGRLTVAIVEEQGDWSGFDRSSRRLTRQASRSPGTRKPQARGAEAGVVLADDRMVRG
jgi:hypothetical protein